MIRTQLKIVHKQRAITTQMDQFDPTGWFANFVLWVDIVARLANIRNVLLHGLGQSIPTQFWHL